MMFHQESYDRHSEWYNELFPTKETKINFYHRRKSKGNNTIAYWLQQLFFSCIDPLLKEKNKNWLTIGDAYGFDAEYVLANGNNALATDLNSDFLEIAKSEGVIKQYAVENAEKLSFTERRFDYVLCKESYHHFPRPYSALYEMIRVAKKGIVLIEPQDPVSKMPILLLLVNLLSTRPKSLSKIWRNHFSFEPVGNFVYKVSEREFEKFAAGLNLPAVAFKKINPNFYFQGAEEIPADIRNKRFLSIRAKKWFLDLMVRLTFIPGQVLVAIVFKQIPEEGIIADLKRGGYQIVTIPPNPYFSKPQRSDLDTHKRNIFRQPF